MNEEQIRNQQLITDLLSIAETLEQKAVQLRTRAEELSKIPVPSAADADKLVNQLKDLGISPEMAEQLRPKTAFDSAPEK